MFTYFEGYHPRVWRGLIKRGFISERTGLRFCQSKTIEESLKFNTLAREGTEFFRLAEEMQCPVYVDRLQGGEYIDEYPYDEKLLAAYRTRIGDRFWGFQMHEWMSNFRSDLGKLVRGDCKAWTADAIEAAIRKLFPFKYLFLESMTAQEMAEHGRAETAAEFYRGAMWLYNDRLARYGDLIPCDSGYLAYKTELDAAARMGKKARIMPEVGAQTPNSRLQIVYAAGMAKAYGSAFGVYYEPWGGSPFSACCYQRKQENEWGIGGPDDFPFQTQGENGGSSRSMQRRIHLYSYLCGASFMSEEWGMCNTFYDWEDFEVSPYGEEKLKFLSFVQKYPVRGRRIAPVAVVLPKDLSVLEGVNGLSDGFCGYPIDAHSAQNMVYIRKNLAAIFAASTEMLGTESVSLINSDIPDAVDLIHADAATLDDYEYLVDLTCDPMFAEYHQGKCILADEVVPVLEKLLPCFVSGGLHWMVNRKPEGGYYLVIFNHSGVERTVAGGEHTMPEADKTVSVQLHTDTALRRLEGTEQVCFENGGYSITVPAGDWFFGEF